MLIPTEKFKVVAVSSNTNSFGLYQCVMVSKSGKGYKACASYLSIPKQGDILLIKLTRPRLIDLNCRLIKF